MSAIVARCGFRCDLCGAFVKKSSTAADRRVVAAAWSKYFRLKVKPASIRCNGCLSQDRGGYEYPAKNCATRRCVIKRNIANCAECTEYPCKALETRMCGVDKIIDRFREKMAKREFDRFIAPYDARITLNRLRQRKST